MRAYRSRRRQARPSRSYEASGQQGEAEPRRADSARRSATADTSSAGAAAEPPLAHHAPKPRAAPLAQHEYQLRRSDRQALHAPDDMVRSRKMARRCTRQEREAPRSASPGSSSEFERVRDSPAASATEPVEVAARGRSALAVELSRARAHARPRAEIAAPRPGPPPLPRGSPTCRPARAEERARVTAVAEATPSRQYRRRRGRSGRDGERSDDSSPPVRSSSTMQRRRSRAGRRTDDVVPTTCAYDVAIAEGTDVPTIAGWMPGSMGALDGPDARIGPLGADACNRCATRAERVYVNLETDALATAAENPHRRLAVPFYACATSERRRAWPLVRRRRTRPSIGDRRTQLVSHTNGRSQRSWRIGQRDAATTRQGLIRRMSVRTAWDRNRPGDLPTRCTTTVSRFAWTRRRGDLIVDLRSASSRR